ncbi:dockerin type I repeat-containing protein [Candidatus Omnitrophota bacterium]
MKRYKICLLVLAGILMACSSSWAYPARQLSQFGITWTFDREYECGQFANGDYWVQGPITIVGISPASVSSGGRIINGSMINPSPRLGSVQGFDTSIRYAYNAALNVARPNNNTLSAANPLNISPGSSLVSTISAGTIDRSSVQTAAILTVLSSPAPSGSFRPAYTNVSKAIRFNKSQLNYSVLGRLAPVASRPRLAQQSGDSQSSSVERMFERPWIDYVPDWHNRFIHPTTSMPDYGREISAQVGIAALMLNLNYSEREKETLMIRFVQLGIDNYGIVQDAGQDNWENNGGHASGRKFPILFSGVVLNDAAMRNIGQKSGTYLYTGSYGPGNEPPDYIHFGEDDQTFYVTQNDVAITNGPNWHPDSRAAQLIPYNQGDIGLVEWGIRHSSYPEADNKYWGANYRRDCTANAWAGFVLATHVMGLKELWNHDCLFDYQDRYMQVTADNGPYPGSRQNSSAFAENMWDAYRNNYGPVWVLDDPSDTYSQGHYEGSGSTTPPPPPPPSTLYGDVSQNSSISAYDASLAAQYAVGSITLTADQITAADVTGNGDVSATDASWIARKAVDPGIRFPVEP